MDFAIEECIIWLDETLLVANKPAGLPTLVDGYDPAAPYLLGALQEVYGKLWVVHRLDRETSGVIVFARTAQAHRALNTQFEKRVAAKLYHALVHGAVEWQEKLVELRLRPDGDRAHRTVIDPISGKSAVTHLRTLERFRNYSLVEAAPKTGRTHQIRAHLAAIGHLIVADALYGDGRGLMLSDLKPGYKGEKSNQAPLLGRLGLHARSLTLEHPEALETLRFEAPYPKDMTSALEQLRKYGSGRVF
jgi:RluA family pseudouridine synthase